MTRTYCCHYTTARTLASATWTQFARRYLRSYRFIPIIGDILIGVWKVNLRNAALLEEFLRVRGEESLRGATGERAFASVRYHRIGIPWQSINWAELFRYPFLRTLRCRAAIRTHPRCCKNDLLPHLNLHSSHVVVGCDSSWCSLTQYRETQYTPLPSDTTGRPPQLSLLKHLTCGICELFLYCLLFIQLYMAGRMRRNHPALQFRSEYYIPSRFHEISECLIR